MTKELDHIMTLDPFSLSAQNIDEIIAYYRQQRADFDAGIKPKKDKGPVKSLDALIPALRPESKGEQIRRRF